MEYNIKVHSPEWYAMCESMDIEQNEIPRPKEVDQENGISTYDIQFIVGGVELDFTKVLNRIYEKHEQYIENEAKEIIENKYQELFDGVDKLKEKVTFLTEKTNEDWD